MSSILTNQSAIVALQTLKSINSNLTKTQSEISTGKSIGTAKDNAAIWAISKVMETDQSAFKTIQKSLNVADAVVATAQRGAEQVVKLLQEMKGLAIDGQNDAADYAKIDADLSAKMEQIDAIIEATQMNGVNLLKAAPTAGQTDYQVLSSLDRASASTAPTPAYINVASADLETAVTGGVTAVTDRATAVTALADIEAMLTSAIDGAAALGTSQKRIADQADFVGALSDSLKLGVGTLVDADIEEASARLQALQTQQQLGIQSLSIANQAPSAIMALFR